MTHGDAAAARGAFGADTIHTTVPNATTTAVRIRRRYQIGCAARRGAVGRYWPCCVMVIGVPVMVIVAVRAGPVFGATANCTVPFPAPEAGVTVRKVALLVAVHAHVLGVVTEIDAEPPDAGNVVVVTPVMIWQPVGPVVELELLSLQAAAERTRARAEHMASVRRE